MNTFLAVTLIGTWKQEFSDQKELRGGRREPENEYPVSMNVHPLANRMTPLDRYLIGAT